MKFAYFIHCSHVTTFVYVWNQESDEIGLMQLYFLLLIILSVTLGLGHEWNARRASAEIENVVESSSIDAVAVTPTYRVAFIFAGSVRSFVYPVVHETIRWNLVNSFCPRHLNCVPDVIARVSMTDNVHRGFNASGQMLKVETGKDSTGVFNRLQESIRHALSRLLLKGESKDHLMIDWTDIGSEKEHQQMESQFPIAYHRRHKIFRLLDSRRYSMYFNRYMAFKTAMEREKTFKGTKKYEYDWLVHIRLDGAWGEPIQDLTKWSPDKVYVPNSWASEIPDTFALLPRKFADHYFSMDKLLIRGVFCLGGGNFDQNTLKPNYLLNSLHFTLPEVIEAKKDDCNLLHVEGDPWNEDNKNGIKWAEEGLSEQILKRKLKNVGISLEKNTLSYYPFFTVIIRSQNLMDICIYLHHFHMIGWARSSQYYPMGIFLACNVMMNDLRKLHHNSYLGCTLKGNRYIGDNCLLNSKISKFNFMPFILSQSRFHNERRCISGYAGGNGNMEGRVTLSPCNKFQSFKDMKALFHSTQMVHFYPHMREPQDIKVIDTSVNPEMMCFTAQYSSMIIVLAKCLGEKGAKTQLFVVNMVKTIDSFNKRKVNYVQFIWSDLGDGNSTNFCITVPDDTDHSKFIPLTLKTCKILGGDNKKIVSKFQNGEMAYTSRDSIFHPHSDGSMFRIDRVNSTTYLRPK